MGRPFTVAATLAGAERLQAVRIAKPTAMNTTVNEAMLETTGRRRGRPKDTNVKRMKGRSSFYRMLAFLRALGSGTSPSADGGGLRRGRIISRRASCRRHPRRPAAARRFY